MTDDDGRKALYKLMSLVEESVRNVKRDIKARNDQTDKDLVDIMSSLNSLRQGIEIEVGKALQSTVARAFLLSLLSDGKLHTIDELKSYSKEEDPAAEFTWSALLAAKNALRIPSKKAGFPAVVIGWYDPNKLKVEDTKGKPWTFKKATDY